MMIIFLQKDYLMSIYGECKDITNALKVFESIPTNKQNIISLSSMIKYCIDHNKNETARSFNATWS